MRLLIGVLLATGCITPAKDSDTAQNTPIDLDGDGYTGISDCNEEDKNIHINAIEVCDGVDNNCDGRTDDATAADATTWFIDGDGDGYGNTTSILACSIPNGYSNQGGDCNDTDAAFHPGAIEGDCTDPRDFNCDGSVLFADTDQDGTPACQDCNDQDPQSYPQATETCDGLDQNCNGLIDDNAVGTLSYMDADQDGYGNPNARSTACTPPLGYVFESGDCNDSDALYHPGAEENNCADPQDYNCDGSAQTDDLDGDGAIACQDCDDGDPTTFPGAHEICNNQDDDCNGLRDDGDGAPPLWYIDQDNDGYGSSLQSQTACSQPAGYSPSADDCDDLNDNYHPGALESDCSDPNDYNCDGSVGETDDDNDGYVACSDCNDTNEDAFPGAPETCDGLDNNCDGQTDEEGAIDAPTWYTDVDNDGYGGTGTRITCSQPAGYVAQAGDCDDNRGSVSPAAHESCNNRDDDCDGTLDEDAIDATVFFIDADNDGYGSTHLTRASCTIPAGFSANADDCDDVSSGIHPNTGELCNGIDDNCDQRIDDNAIDAPTWYRDNDGDGDGTALYTVASCDVPSGYVASNTDCNDSLSSIHPGAEEHCDGQDEDCDGRSDEDAVDASPWYIDLDGDLYGNGSPILACNAPAGYVAQTDDCNDQDRNIHPDAAEICDSSLTDENCNGLSNDDDPSLSNPPSWYTDADQDGYGSSEIGSASLITACIGPSGTVSNNTDCDDSNIQINPAAIEICDPADIDENCDGISDNDDPNAYGSLPWHPDNDQDGYGNANETRNACDQPAGYLSDATDCDDSRNSVHPGGLEVCDSADADEDCNGLADDADPQVYNSSKSRFYLDADSDNYGDSSHTTTACNRPAGYVPDGTDCDDSRATIHPNATEICDRLNRDEDCDGQVDDADPSVDHSGYVTFYIDTDRDGYGGSTQVQACDALGNYVTSPSDCNDSNASIHPNGTEICDANNVDEDCDGLADDADPSASGALTYYIDADNDGYGNSSSSLFRCEMPTGYIDNADDCDDSNGNISPGHTEICDSNNYDEDCDGLVEDNDPSVDVSTTATWYLDADFDLFGDASISVDACDAPAGYLSDAQDCDDTDTNTHPGAQEVCDSLNHDEDCDLLSDDADPDVATWTWSAFYQDSDLDGFGNINLETFACDAPAGYSIDASDCDDTNDSINIDALEICDPLDTDEDCDGSADDNDGSTDPSSYNSFYGDNDLDGFGDPASLAAACDVSAGYSSNAQDCDDTDIHVNPNGTEVCGNGVNDDCSSTDACAWNGLHSDQEANANYLGLSLSTGSLGSVLIGGKDLNGDGLPDIVIGDPSYDLNTAPAGRDRGRLYLLFGASGGPTATLSSPSGSLLGSTRSDQLGQSISLLDDINADSKDELLVGIPGNDAGGTDAGGAVLFVGPATGTLNLNNARITLTGSSVGETAGWQVADMGDLSGDGMSDWAISADLYGTTGAQGGRVGIVSGGLPAGSYPLNGLGTLITGVADERLGSSLSEQIDINGDGQTDALMMAVGDSSAYAFFGPLSGALATTDADLVISDISQNVIGVQTISPHSLAPTGDNNGDGYEDLLIGADHSSNGSLLDAGAAYLFLGPLLSDTATSAADATFSGNADSQFLGRSVAAAGDVNNDSLADILIGLPGDSDGGSAVLFHGPLLGAYTPASAEAALFQGSVVAGDLGTGVAGVGSVDGDAYDDILLGAPNTTGVGQALLFYGTGE